MKKLAFLIFGIVLFLGISAVNALAQATVTATASAQVPSLTDNLIRPLSNPVNTGFLRFRKV